MPASNIVRRSDMYSRMARVVACFPGQAETITVKKMWETLGCDVRAPHGGRGGRVQEQDCRKMHWRSGFQAALRALVEDGRVLHEGRGVYRRAP